MGPLGHIGVRRLVEREVGHILEVVGRVVGCGVCGYVGRVIDIGDFVGCGVGG